MAANLENALLDNFSDNLDELPPEAIKNKLKKLEQEFDQLLIMAGEGNEIADRKLEQIGKEMRELKEKDQELEDSEYTSQRTPDQGESNCVLISVAFWH